LASNDCWWRKADLRPILHVEGQNQISIEHNNSGATLKPEIALPLNSDLADPASDGMFPTA
jgi:hypothetical protein